MGPTFHVLFVKNKLIFDVPENVRFVVVVYVPTYTSLHMCHKRHVLCFQNMRFN